MTTFNPLIEVLNGKRLPRDQKMIANLYYHLRGDIPLSNIEMEDRFTKKANIVYMWVKSGAISIEEYFFFLCYDFIFEGNFLKRGNMNELPIKDSSNQFNREFNPLWGVNRKQVELNFNANKFLIDNKESNMMDVVEDYSVAFQLLDSGKMTTIEFWYYCTRFKSHDELNISIDEKEILNRFQGCNDLLISL